MADRTDITSNASEAHENAPRNTGRSVRKDTRNRDVARRENRSPEEKEASRRLSERNRNIAITAGEALLGGGASMGARYVGKKLIKGAGKAAANYMEGRAKKKLLKL